MRAFTTVTILLGLSAAGFGQDTAKKINKVPITYTSPTSGAEMFRSYCASCHGPDGKGTGPAAAALKTPPADLTLLSRKNGGKFPALKVQGTIKGDPGAAAHGSREMPVWGDIFGSVSAGSGAVEIRVRNLRDYVESIQQK